MNYSFLLLPMMGLDQAFKIIAVPTQKNCLKNSWMRWFAF